MQELISFQRDLTDWTNNRKKITTMLKHVINMQSRLSYVTDDRLQSAALDELVNADDFNVSMFEDIHKAIKELHSLQSRSIDLMGSLVAWETDISERYHSSSMEVQGSSITSDRGPSNGHSSAPSSSSSTFTAVDMELVRSVNKQVKKQQLLEMHVIAKVVASVDSESSSGQGPLGHDEAVTLLACFAYPPYLIMSDLHSVMSIHTT